MTVKKSAAGIGAIILFLATFTCLLVYLVAQQSIRLGANTLPAQQATEISIQLEQGRSVSDVIPAGKTDLTRSLSPFVLVYDQAKKLVASSAMMGGGQPAYPLGVLDAAAQKGESRVTWQPQSGLRYATVAFRYEDGYVVAGQSLSEAEKLIDKIGLLVLAAWGACIVLTVVVLGFVSAIAGKGEKRVG